MVYCTKCRKDAVTYIRYNGSHLCPDHFLEYVERRVKAELRRQVDLDTKSHLAVALSGGKDSAITLFILSRILRNRKKIRLSAITVDEGIDGYRPLTLIKAGELTETLGINHLVVSFRDEFGTDLDSIVKSVRGRTACTYCGVLRRRCVNKTARENGVDVIATGLNLDDTAQSLLMNFTRGDVERLARLGPHTKVQPGLIPRIQPLRCVPEKESFLYAMLRGVPFSADVCPYADEALRNEYRDIVDRIEDRSPGTKYSILASYDALLPMLREHFPPTPLGRCACGEPAIKEKCMACELLEGLSAGQGHSSSL